MATEKDFKPWSTESDQKVDPVPYSLRAIVVGVARFTGHEAVLTVIGKQGEDDLTARSLKYREQVTFNEKIVDLMKAQKIDPNDRKVNQYWCDDCGEGDYHSCEYVSPSSPECCPEYWLKQQEEKAAAKPGASNGAGTGWKPGHGKQQDEKPKAKPVTGFASAPTPPPKPATTPVTPISQLTKTQPKAVMPHGMFFRCPRCWHWFDSEHKLAAHAQWACAGEDGATPDTTHIAMKCVCHDTLNEVLVNVKPEVEVGVKVEDTKSDAVAHPAEDDLSDDGE